jgi:hypothetical protein
MSLFLSSFHAANDDNAGRMREAMQKRETVSSKMIDEEPRPNDSSRGRLV